MRFHLLGLIAIGAAAIPAAAQQRQPVILQPEIRQQQQQDYRAGVPASSALGDLMARMEALEAQVVSLTGQLEESQNRVRQLEGALERLQGSTESRLAAVEAAARPPEPVAAPPQRDARTEPAPAPATGNEAGPSPARSADAAEAAYNAGYRLWNDRRYEEAQAALEAVARDHPNSRWASWARNLAGRAYLDDDKPATAARILLENYQANPRGERAADSLFFLGEALVRLNRRTEACRVYDELQDVYGANMRDFIRQRLPQARTAARCTN